LRPALADAGDEALDLLRLAEEFDRLRQPARQFEEAILDQAVLDVACASAEVAAAGDALGLRLFKQPFVLERSALSREGLHNLLRERIAALRGVGFGRFASHRLRRCEPSPKLRFRSLA